MFGELCTLNQNLSLSDKSIFLEFPNVDWTIYLFHTVFKKQF